METLSARFNALQERLMDIYESGPEDLATQIEHWQLLRQEQIILHYARQHGVMRLGYQLVPPLATSEQKAKDAISMVLVLQSLQRSAYGNEPWTLVQTSLETFRTPPADCFKKGPKNIEVYFDGDSANVMIYTVYTHIYYQTVDDTWEKVEGHVDYEGAYFMEGTAKTYYITFAADAARYGKTGHWEVHVNKDTVFAPVTSSSPPTGDGASINSVSGAAASPTPQRPAPRRPQRYGRKASSPTTTSKRQTRQRQKETTRTTRSRSGSRTRPRDQERRGRTVRDSSRSPDRGGRRGSGRGPLTRSRSRSGSRSTGSASGGGVSPADVGKSVRTVSGRHNTRLEELLADAKDPPVILLRGNPNTLKCYRYRARQRHKGGFQYFSTTWSWVGEGSCERVGRARMLISFYSKSQREHFIQTMKLPPKVDWSYGNFADL